MDSPEAVKGSISRSGLSGEALCGTQTETSLNVLHIKFLLTLKNFVRKVTSNFFEYKVSPQTLKEHKLNALIMIFILKRVSEFLKRLE